MHCSPNTLTAFILKHLYTNDLPYHKGRENHSILTPPTLPLHRTANGTSRGKPLGAIATLYIYELPPAEGGAQWGQELIVYALKARAGGLGLLVLLELTLQDVDTEIDRFLEAVACLVDKEVCTIDLELDGGFLVIGYFGLDNL